MTGLPEKLIELGGRELWRIGNERIGFREWESVREHYLAEAEAVLTHCKVDDLITLLKDAMRYWDTGAEPSNHRDTYARYRALMREIGVTT